MTHSLALIAYLIPLGYLAAALLSLAVPGRRPRLMLMASRTATVLALGTATFCVILLMAVGPMTSPAMGLAGFGLSARLDALSVVMLVLVNFIGLVVVQYSRSYLDGDARQGIFLGGLCLTLAAVSLLVMAGNLTQLTLAWISTSLALHRLLVFYPERPKAVIAARKKFLTARIGDACLIAAALLLARAFGTGDIATILGVARTGESTAPVAVWFAAFLLAIAALLKSAQFPSHGWLTEVMETPTPVSALLHAGIINAGGFLIIRFADVMLMTPPALHLLAILGGFTALFGAVVMLTQTSVKVALAWSTLAQMGFMLLQCGLGAFPLAVLHIVAHSLYKAHAFLASGSVIEIARGAWAPDPADRSGALPLVASLVLALALYAGIGWLLAPAEGTATLLSLGAILVMGLFLLIAQSFGGGAQSFVIGRTCAAAAGATVAYFALQAVARWLMYPTLPPIPEPGPIGLIIMALAVASFAAVTLAQALAPRLVGTAAFRAARVHAANGLYVNAWLTRRSAPILRIDSL